MAQSNQSTQYAATLGRLVANESFKQSVTAMLQNKRMAHSLLLCGEAGVGARFAARLVASCYLYPEGGSGAAAMIRGEGCNALAAKGGEKTGRIETGIVREAIIVSGDGKADTIKVSQIRALRREIINSSLSAQGRVVLIYGAEKMQPEAANALLKILEEPPEGVLFLLTASSLAAVLPTIRSRCIGFAISPAPVAECASFCTKQGVKAPLAAHLSEVFDGHIGTVLEAAKNKKRTQALETAAQLAAAAAKGDAYTAAILLASFEKDRAGATGFLTDFISLVFAGMQNQTISPLTGKAALHAIRAAQMACGQLAANTNAKACLSLLAIRLGRCGTL